MTLNKLKTIMILGLVVYSTLLSYVHFTESSDYTVVHDTIPGDSVFTEIKVKEFVPKIVTVQDIDTIYIPQDCDSLRNYYIDLLHQHYSNKYYKDTLKNDTSATIVLESYVSQNNLDSVNIGFKNNRPTAINTTIINNAPKLNVGLGVGYRTISPFIQYNFNNKYSIGLSYNAYDLTSGNTLLPIGISISYNIK